MTLDRPIVRLAIGAALIGVAVLGLWLSGAAFRSPGSSETVTPAGERVALQPADASIDTPSATGLTVGLKEGNLAPDFEFSAFDGRRLKLSDFRGQVVFLNFWATWCRPCRVELPDMETVLRRRGAEGVAVIAMNNGEAFAPADRYLKDIGVELTAWGYDPTSRVAERYGVRGLPKTLIIDARGVISRVHDGQLSLRVMEEFVQAALEARTP